MDVTREEDRAGFGAGMAGRWLAFLLALCLLWMASHVWAAGGDDGTRHPVFYPQPPDAPRIQHLATLTGERDLGGKQSGFAAFLLGDEATGGRLIQPYGAAMFDGRLFVADTGAPGIAIFDFTKNSFAMFEGTGNGRLKKPINIRVDREGNRYVTDTGRNQVLVYDRTDRFVAAFGIPGQFKPVDVAIAGDRLYVSDIDHHQIHVLDRRTGQTLFKFGKAGSGVGELFHPTNLAIGPEGDLFVVETSNYRIQRFAADGTPLRIYGAVGNAPGSFARPKGIALDRQGRMYVGDAAFENVQMFDPNGQLLMYFGQPGEGQEGLNLPAGVSIDYEHVDLFRRYAHPDFRIEYLILVASQFGPNKIDVFGFGRLRGMSYPEDAGTEAPAAPATDR